MVTCLLKVFLEDQLTEILKSLNEETGHLHPASGTENILGSLLHQVLASYKEEAHLPSSGKTPQSSDTRRLFSSLG